MSRALIGIGIGFAIVVILVALIVFQAWREGVLFSDGPGWGKRRSR